jgi:hypothetical protein
MILSMLSFSQAKLEAWAIDHYGEYTAIAAGRQDSFLQWLFYFSPYVRIGEFLLGCLAAQLYLVLKPVEQKSREMLIGRIATAVSILSIVLLIYLMHSSAAASTFFAPYMNFALAPSVAAMILCVARYDTAVSRLLSRRPLVLLGDASYSIYLLHILLLSLVFGIGGPMTAQAESDGAILVVGAMRLALIVALILVFSLGTYSFIEAPARRYLRSWFKSALPRWRRVAIAGASIPALLSVAVIAVPPALPQERSIAAGIRIVSATYGQNCGAPVGNASSFLKKACDGRDSCNYVVKATELGDPANGCEKSFAAEFECAPDRTRHRQEVPPEAGFGGLLVLTCPTPTGASVAPSVREEPQR